MKAQKKQPNAEFPETILVRCRKGTKAKLDRIASKCVRGGMVGHSRSDVARVAIASYLNKK